MCIRDRNTSTYSPPEDGSRQPTRFSEASRRELAETENLLRVETQHAAPDEAGVCALFRYYFASRITCQYLSASIRIGDPPFHIDKIDSVEEAIQQPRVK